MQNYLLYRLGHAQNVYFIAQYVNICTKNILKDVYFTLPLPKMYNYAKNNISFNSSLCYAFLGNCFAYQSAPTNTTPFVVKQIHDHRFCGLYFSPFFSTHRCLKFTS